MRQRVQQLSPEQQERLRNHIITEKLKKRRVRVGGKRVRMAFFPRSAGMLNTSDVGAVTPMHAVLMRQHPAHLARMAGLSAGMCLSAAKQPVMAGSMQRCKNPAPVQTRVCTD
jgi:hypothetical protein